MDGLLSRPSVAPAALRAASRFHPITEEIQIRCRPDRHPLDCRPARGAPHPRRGGARSFASTRQGGLAAEEDVFGLVDFGGEIITAAAIGMNLHHQTPVGGADFAFTRTTLQPQYAERLGARHR